MLSAFGEGAFLTGSAVFFTAVVGLSAQQVGLGLSIAAAVQFACSVPLGRLADRIGAKRMWQAARPTINWRPTGGVGPITQAREASGTVVQRFPG